MNDGNEMIITNMLLALTVEKIMTWTTTTTMILLLVILIILIMATLMVLMGVALIMLIVITRMTVRMITRRLSAIMPLAAVMINDADSEQWQW